MSRARARLAERFAAILRTRSDLGDGDTLVVAVSGGVDSVTLLHLLRFAPDDAGATRPHLVVAHVDHAMRADSAADHAWVRELAAAWDVPVRSTRLDPPPPNEAEARRRRYEYLEAVRSEVGARLVLTGHHADDQAETVLFRALRGAGIGGLRGIRARRGPAIWRPLLPFWRDDIVAYAREHGLRWREDATNREPFARNVIRHRILPEAEASVAAGARRSLVDLARHARANEAAWRSLTPRLLDELDTREEVEGFSLAREGLVAHHPEVRARLIRSLAGRLGETLSRAGTRPAVEFTSSGESGTEISLGGGLSLRREFDRFVVAREGPSGPDEPLRIVGAGDGEGSVTLRGAVYQVRWTLDPQPGPAWREAFSVAEVRFPLTVRAWAPGDRARLPYGSKKLKKLFLEARVPSGQRHRTPVLADAAGRILWVPEVVRSTDAPPGEDERVLYIGITRADSD